jgi:AraC-like DNA-binding protein
VHAGAGVMTVTTAQGAYVVPPERGVWMPAGVAHRIDARTAVAMRTLYVGAAHTAGLPERVCVVQVTRLLRELILAAVAGGNRYTADSPQARVVAVILDQIRALPVAPLSLPAPRDPRLLRVTAALQADPASTLGLADWARHAGASERTLARLFEAETGMSFRAWRQQLRLLRALERLAAGTPVTRVALDLGYESTSAFSAMFRRALGTAPTRYFGHGI